jgi:hypothetical protein
VNPRRALAGWLAWLGCVLTPAYAATIVINVTDGPGEGFNDTAAFTPIGGNAATTLGEARRNVFNEAARLWGPLIDSRVTIGIDANFDVLDCSASSGTLGQAGPTGFYHSGAGTVWYPAALYNAVRGSKVTSGSDIAATFNSSVGTSACLGGRPFYYGLDHNYSHSTYVADLLEVVMHELGHGLGFISVVNADGSGLNGLLSVFDQHIFDETQGKFWTALTAAERATSSLNDGNLVWNGANVNNQLGILTAGKTSGQHVRLYAPATWDDGSSVSHWDTTAAPNLLMEAYATGSTRGYTDLTPCALYDIGWTGSHCPDVAGANATPVATGQSVSTTAGTAVAITLTASDADSTALSYSIVSGPAHGVLSGSGSARTYTPNASFTGTDSFTFQASDGFSSSNVATVTITVSAAASAASQGGGGGGALPPWTLLAFGALAFGSVVARRRAFRRRAAMARAPRQHWRRRGARSTATAPTRRRATRPALCSCRPSRRRCSRACRRWS